MNVIETKSLTKKYGATTVVNDISLTIEAGEIFGFLGTNGAGKSTFINMITGIILPTSGEYKLLGSGMDEIEKMKDKIGVLPDYSSFYDDLSPLQHLEFYSSILKTKKSKADLLHLLNRVGLSEAAHRKTKKFSFGMKKKLGIAQALINDPDLIFLDEPTSGVDAESILDIHSLILELHKEGKTIFMTSHNLDEVEKICTKIGIMRDGTISSLGSMDQLKKQHQKAYRVSIKLRQDIGSKKTVLKKVLSGMADDIVYTNEYVHFTVAEEHKISAVIRAMIISDLDILRVEVEEPTLQDIFLRKEQSVV
ncbi:ABC transporter ATP-binding protein [Bacillus sp. FSL H8-0547]